jgi:hypothetical protein
MPTSFGSSSIILMKLIKLAKVEAIGDLLCREELLAIPHSKRTCLCQVSARKISMQQVALIRNSQCEDLNQR